VRLGVKEASYRDGEGGEPFLALDELRLVASRLDPRAKVFAADEVVLAGLTLAAERGKEGQLALLGLEMSPAPAAEPAAKETQTRFPPRRGEAQGVVLQHSQIPTLSLAKVDLDLARFTFVDRSAAEATPITTGLRLRNKTPIVLDPGGPGRDAAARAAADRTGEAGARGARRGC
jgi:hypothetical protein